MWTILSFISLIISITGCVIFYKAKKNIEEEKIGALQYMEHAYSARVHELEQTIQQQKERLHKNKNLISNLELRGDDCRDRSEELQMLINRLYRELREYSTYPIEVEGEKEQFDNLGVKE